MTLARGTKLGAYEVLEPLGAGGMGEVYRAKDTRLDRTVAIKVLPEHVAQDADLRQRFEREAKTISSLNHPNICTLHDIGSENGVDFLVMEYIEGETLAQRIARSGALPPADVLRYAIEIAEGLDIAHRHGVTHRDLKPGNIMLTKPGAKLVDFGLAKFTGRGAVPDLSGLSALPTEARPLTEKGALLGTFQYMAPEQLEGKEADTRTDIFAFGAVVYEMATGKKAFEGKSQASLIAAILERDPKPMSALAPLAPKALERLVKKCLAKDPDDRWYTVHDLADALLWIRDGGETASAPKHASGSRAAILGAGIVMGAIIATMAAFFLRPAEEPRGVVRFPVVLPDSLTLSPTLDPKLAISPDGRSLAYVASGRIFLRELGELEARALSGTDGEPRNLAFSPDGQWIAFYSEGQIRKAAISGGAPVKVCDTDSSWGLVWGRDDVLRYGSETRGPYAVPASGGTPQPIFPSEETWEPTVRPVLLPDGRTIVYVEGDGRFGSLVARSLEGGDPKVLVDQVADFRYTPTGHIVYGVASGDLLSARFDPERLELGSPTPVAEGVDPGQFDISAAGALFYVPSGESSSSLLVWVDRKGVVTPAVEDRPRFTRPRLSPDGRRVAVEVFGSESGLDIWVYDLERGTRTRVTTELGLEQDPIWTPDGKNLIYGTGGAIYARSADGSGEAETLVSGKLAQEAHSWSPDGRALAYYVHAEVESRDIWILPMEGDRTPVPYLTTPFNERSPSFSPDGRFIAYVSDASGRDEVYVQPYPGPGPREVISTNGGYQPVWSRDGKELFYRNGDRMMAVAIQSDPEFRAGVPELLFEGLFLSERPTSGSQSYDVSLDGQRFLMVQSQGSSNQLQVVLNWFEELEARVP